MGNITRSFDSNNQYRGAHNADLGVFITSSQVLQEEQIALDTLLANKNFKDFCLLLLSILMLTFSALIFMSIFGDINSNKIAVLAFFVSSALVTTGIVASSWLSH